MAEPDPKAIPSGGSKRRHPWASYVGVTSLAVASLALLLTSAGRDRELRSSPEYGAAAEFFAHNPDVEISDAFAALLGDDLIDAARALQDAKREAGAVPVMSERMLDKTQKRFDQLEADALASLDQLPAWRFGVGGPDTPIGNWFAHVVANETMVSFAISMAFLTLFAITLEGAWGSAVFGVFLLLLPLVSAGGFRLLGGDSPVPWAGPSGVVAGLLGAYFVRSFRGFVVPGWLVLPVWIVAEYLFAREISLSGFDVTPVLVHGAAFGFGAAVAVFVGFSGLEDRFERAVDETADLVSNPVLDDALQAREEGDAELAYSMLEEELKRSPRNADVAVAFWEVARALQRCGAAEPTMVAAVRASLRAGERGQAASLWNAVACDIQAPTAEPTLLVRIGEALIQEGHRDAGLAAFALALDSPRQLSSVLAARVVRAAKQHQPELAARAASIALTDGELDPNERDVLQTFVSRVEAAGGPSPPEPLSAPPPRAAGAAAAPPAPAREAQPVAPEPATDPAIDGIAEDVLADLPGETREIDPYQDPHALAADDFEDTAAVEDAPPETWNQVGVLEDLSSELPDASPAVDEDASGFDWQGLDASTGPGGDPVEQDETETTETLEPQDPVGEVLDEPLARRSLLLRKAVPLSIDDAGVTCEIDGGSKTTLRWDRVEAIAVGAVDGLSQKRVIVIDLVLNWVDLPDQPLKVVRIRSDGFDPRRLHGGGSALEALRGLLERIESVAGATLLPDAAGARGRPFAKFPSLEDYERSVLMVAA